MRTLLAAAIIALLASFQLAVAEDDLGPTTGTNAPDIGTPIDQSGKPRSFASLMGDKGTVFSLSTCPESMVVASLDVESQQVVLG